GAQRDGGGAHLGHPHPVRPVPADHRRRRGGGPARVRPGDGRRGAARGRRHRRGGQRRVQRAHQGVRAVGPERGGGGGAAGAPARGARRA
ncbi:MAG: hypothetical protein VX670_12090, partial [Candidatus Latescibacterota bacterium]|nr:hypothetical protein [Candidatus Latescibacterota bacterium]